MQADMSATYQADGIHTSIAHVLNFDAKLFSRAALSSGTMYTRTHSDKMNVGASKSMPALTSTSLTCTHTQLDNAL